MGQQQYRHVLRRFGRQRGLQLLSLQQGQGAAVLFAQAFGNVQVGREIISLRDDSQPCRVVVSADQKRSTEHLVQVDRGAVGGHHLGRSGTDQGGDAVAQALRQVKPASLVPGSDQALAPFLAHHLRHPGGGGAWQHAERVAVQVNQAGWQLKLLAQAAQRVLLVELLAVFKRGHGRSRRMARTGEASASMSLRGRAISS